MFLTIWLAVMATLALGVLAVKMPTLVACILTGLACALPYALAGQ